MKTINTKSICGLRYLFNHLHNPPQKLSHLFLRTGWYNINLTELLNILSNNCLSSRSFGNKLYLFIMNTYSSLICSPNSSVVLGIISDALSFVINRTNSGISVASIFPSLIIFFTDASIMSNLLVAISFFLLLHNIYFFKPSQNKQ